MINNFQKSLILNEECIWEIVKMFHPDIKESSKKKIKAYTKYDWICIEGPGISIGVEFECHLMSGKKPLHLFEQELKNNKFTCWRFVDDSRYKLEKEHEYLKTLYKNVLNDILAKHNISKPTAKQISDYYHSD